MGKDDFWLVYSPNGQQDRLADIISALYYLPENFKLMIKGDWSSSHEHPDLKERLQRETNPTNSSLFASARIYDDTLPDMAEDTLAIVIDPKSSSDLERNHRYFAVSNKPEAIASAALRIAHAISD